MNTAPVTHKISNKIDIAKIILYVIATPSVMNLPQAPNH